MNIEGRRRYGHRLPDRPAAVVIQLMFWKQRPPEPTVTRAAEVSTSTALLLAGTPSMMARVGPVKAERGAARRRLRNAFRRICTIYLQANSISM
jgi:hypothetical protein